MILAILLLLSGLTISAVAIYYSVAGLIAIFSAAAIPIMVMGISLEVGKLVIASWVKARWTQAPFLMKTYAIFAVAILMVITSLGIFGFLSKAHSDQTLVSGDVQSKIAIYDEKIKTAKENIESDRKQLKQMDEAVDQVMGRSSDEKGADKAVAIRKGQQKDRASLAKDIEIQQKLISSLNDEAAPIRAEVRKVESEVGPIKYIAAFIYGDNPDANVLERAVTWVIILIVIVFDPLAVVMLLASQMTFGWVREEKEQKQNPKYEIDDGPLSIDQINQLKTTVEQPEEIPVDIDVIKELDDPIKCYKCDTVLVDAPGIGLVCPNKECDVIDNTKGEEPIELLKESTVPYTIVDEEHTPDYVEPTVITKQGDPSNGGFLKQHTLTIREQEENNNDSVLDKHPYLQEPYKHFENLEPVVYKQEETNDIIDVVDRPGDYLEKSEANTELGPDFEGVKVDGEWVQTGPAFNETEKDVIDTSHPFAVVHDDYVEYEGKKMHKQVLASLRPDLGIVVDDPVEPDVTFGENFPKHPKLGDMFTRVDVMPHRIFKFNGRKWIEINRTNTDSHLSEEKYLQYLIEKIANGEYDPDHLSAGEQDAIAQYIKNTNPNS